MKQSKLLITAALLVAAFLFQPNTASAVVVSANPTATSVEATAPALTK